MADCGATGTTLDRTVQSLLGGNGGNVQQSKAAQAVLGHASQQPAAGAAAMPTTAPLELTLPAGAPPTVRPAAAMAPTTAISLPPQQQQQQAPFATAAPSTTAAAPMTQHNPYHQGPNMSVHPHQQQQQQQMIMMQSMMMMQQQQQQLAQMAQQQQQQQPANQQAQQAQETTHLPSTSTFDGANNDSLKAEMTHHLETLQHDHNSEGFAQGATIEELAAAWAEAEAEYAQELHANVDDATNLAAAVDTSSGPQQLQPYEFVNRVDAQQEQPLNTTDWMAEGLRQFDAGNLTEAIRAFELELQQQSHGNNAKAWHMLGKCHAENDQDREAIVCLEHAVDRDPYLAAALLDLGVSYVNELNHDKALEALGLWITHNPNYAGLELNNMEANDEDDIYGEGGGQNKNNSKGGAFEQVQRLLIRALEFDTHQGPSSSSAADVLQALGVVYNVSRDYQAAVDSLQQALALRPDDYQLWNKLGATLANSNRSAEALPAYHEALQRKPKYARAWLNLAISHSNLHHYDEAARCYLQTLSLNPSALHCWSYLRIALSCAERFDLIPLAASQNLNAFQEHFDFVLYNNDDNSKS